MTYNRFVTPRAYIDLISYHLATGWRSLSDITFVQDDGSSAVTFNNNTHMADLFDMKPHKFAQIDDATRRFYINIDTGLSSPDSLAESNFIAILNHNMHDADVSFNVKIDDASDFSSATTVTADGSHNKIINATQNTGTLSSHIHPANNGWTLITWNTAETDNRYMRITFSKRNDVNTAFSEDLIIGGILWGEYVDFPQSPDLEIKTSVVYDNVNLNQSVSGSSYANSPSFGAPTWNHTTPWSLSTSDSSSYAFLQKHGRTNHSLKFSYLSDSEVYAQGAGSGTSSKWFDDSSLHASFYNRIIGQQLPFMFTPDGTSTEETNYGLFRLANDNFTANQVAHRIWNTSLDLVETW
tara:strand:- start:48 stop:1106 length:1059 start_codon:yes stop_codon:yes gene_type:complete